MPIRRSVHRWTAGGRGSAARVVTNAAALAPCSWRALLAPAIGGPSLARRARQGRAAGVEESRGRRVRIRRTRESRHHLLRPAALAISDEARA
jgi:hypothetical protein